MSDPLTRTLALYALSIAVGALVAGLAVMATQLAGTDPVNWRPILAAMLGPIIAGLAAARLPKPEESNLDVQVQHLKASDVPLTHMVIEDAESKRVADAATKHAEDALAGKAPAPLDHTASAPVEVSP